jgi:hypothetical protein
MPARKFILKRDGWQWKKVGLPTAADGITAVFLCVLTFTLS